MPPLVRWLLSFGPTNPIAVRLVQNASRRTRHLTIRSAYLGALVVVLLWALLVKVQGGSADYRALALAGAASFQLIAYLQIGLICILTPVFMAGAIAQEANPRTWDIMLSTPLSSGQIVLGNLSGRLFFVLGLLVSGLPLFALTQYFGGVPGRSIFASYAIAATAALLVGAIAIALSVSRLVGRRAVFAFYVSVVSYLAVTWAVDMQLRVPAAAGGTAKYVTWMTGLNPFLALHALLAPSSYVSWPEGSPWALRHPVTAWCVGSGALSLVMVVAAIFTVRLGGLTALARGSAAVPWYRRVFGLGAKGAEHRPPRAVWHNPIAWREAAARNSTLGRMAARWAFVGLGGAFGVGLVWWFHTSSWATIPQFRSVLLATVWGELAVIALVAVNMSATAVSREREDGTLDLLLTTPITPGAYLMGKLRGLIAYLVPLLLVPLGTLAIASAYVAAGGLGRAGGVVETKGGGASAFGATPVAITIQAVSPEAAIVAPLIVFPFIAFCCMVGLYWSLKSKGTLSSVVGAVAVAGVVGAIIGLCGWRSGSDMEVLGPVLAGMSPATAVYALVDPYNAMTSTVLGRAGTFEARLALGIGAAIGAGVFIGVVAGLHASMVRGFDMTVRKLAGTK